MASMSRLDRVRAAARREAVDRPPYLFWRHFPAADRSPAALGQAALRFHDRYGSDLLVVAPRAGYAAEAWGCVEADTVRADGSRPCARCAITRPEDWRAVRPLDPAAAPGYTDVMEMLVRVGFDRRIGDAPVLVTLPAPSTVAARLSGGRLGAHLREWPGRVGDALRALAETQLRFAELCLREGLAGVLYAVHVPAEPALGPSAYAEMLEPHDHAVLAALAARAALCVADVAGAVPFARITAWPADVVGWAASADAPPLADGHARLRAAALGGLDARALQEGPPAAAVQAAQAAVAATGGRGLVVGPSGPIWPDTADEVLAAVVRALGGTTRPILGITR
jgi:uroporphyrinogen decarboxylase